MREVWIRKWIFLIILRKAFIKLGNWMSSKKIIDPKWLVLLLSTKITWKVLSSPTIIFHLIFNDSQLSVDSQKIIVHMVCTQNSSMNNKLIHVKFMHSRSRIIIKSNIEILKLEVIDLKMGKELIQLQKATKFY